jgi:DNA-binding SARP family transcriptional activator
MVLAGRQPDLPCRERPTKKKVFELLCYLACHPGKRFTAAELTTVLWPPELGDTGRRKSVQNCASLLRKAVGAEHFPEADGSGYALSSSVTTDFARLGELVKRSRSAPPNEARQLLRQALSLVRGEP